MPGPSAGWATRCAALILLLVCPSGVAAVGAPRASHRSEKATGSDDAREKRGMMRSEGGRGEKVASTDFSGVPASLAEGADVDPEILKVVQHIGKLAAGMQQDVLPSEDAEGSVPEGLPPRPWKNASLKLPPGAFEQEHFFSEEDTGDGVGSSSGECLENRRRSRRRESCPAGLEIITDPLLLQEDELGDGASAAGLLDQQTSQPEAHYEGCYRDSSSRDLTHYAGRKSHSQCQAACAGWAYFGRQASQECWCGNTFGKYNARNDCSCSSTQIGSWRNCVYRVPHVMPKFLGCYRDSSTRDLPHYLGIRYRIVDCEAACGGYAFFGRQANLQCFCGNSYGRYGTAGCSPSSTSYIGSWVNAVYRVTKYSLKYEGCYLDGAARDLTHYVGTQNIGNCQARCSSYNFFARQSYAQCFCGNGFGKFGARSDCQCSSSGDIGGWRNCIYSASNSLVDASYEGCFADSWNRDLPYYAGVLSYPDCKAACQSFDFFGRQAGSECWCGNSYGKHSWRFDCNCDSSYQGSWRNCVYRNFKECASRRRSRRRARRRVTCKCPFDRRRTRRRTRRREVLDQRRRRVSLIAYLHKNAASARRTDAERDPRKEAEESLEQTSDGDGSVGAEDTSSSVEPSAKSGKKGASLAVLLGHASRWDDESTTRRRVACWQTRRRSRRRARRRSRRRVVIRRRREADGGSDQGTSAYLEVSQVVSLKSHSSKQFCKVASSTIVCDQETAEYEKFTPEMQFKVVDCGNGRVCLWHEQSKKYCGWDSSNELVCTFSAISDSTKLREEQQGKTWDETETGYFAIKRGSNEQYCVVNAAKHIHCNQATFSNAGLFTVSMDSLVSA
mmetsp:Transcript_17145/g.36808  ORF Transcript_17145/g.36808 Transcript_17145/m.36808 type:complete len:842 (-) Transcript_17145:90-2615(-)